MQPGTNTGYSATLDEPMPALDAADAHSFGNGIHILVQLLRRRRLIVTVTATFMLFGLILAFVLPVRYTATAKLMPPKQAQSALSLIATQLGGGMGALADSAGGLGLKDPNAIYIGLLKSRPVSDNLIERFDLQVAYRTKDMTGARKKLDENTVIVSEKSTLIAISVTDPDKKRAAEMANAYTELLRDLTRSVSVTEASRRRLFFEDKLREAKQNLVAAEQAFQQVQQSKGLVHLDAQANAIIVSLAGVRADISAKQVEIEALRSYSTERNPDVQLAERELSALQAQAAQLEQHGNSSAFSEMGLKDVPGAGLDYLRAARELEYQQSFFDVLLKQYEAARLDEAKEATIIQVVEPAIPPDRKSAPKRAAILVIFTFLGFFSGCAGARLMDWLEAVKADPERAQALRELRNALIRRKSVVA